MLTTRASIFAIAVLVFSHAASGQARKITADDLEHVIAMSKYKALHLAVRITTTSTGYEPGTSSKLVRERDADGSEHWIEISRRNGKESRSEMMTIGSQSYIRVSGKWLKGGIGGGSGSGGPSSVPEIRLEYSYLGRQKINGRWVDHFRKLLIRKYADAKTPTQRNTQEYWFASDGLLVKESLEDIFEKTTQHLKRVTVYEYDPKIKITEPKID